MFQLRFDSRFASITIVRSSALGLALLLSACVAPIPITDQAPKVSYSTNEKIAVAVIDARPVLKSEQKPATYIGRAHGVFGIPSDMQLYPWVALKEEKNLTLAQELEQRIAEGLQTTGANTVRVQAAEHADAAAAKRAALALDPERILLISLDEWAVDINLNWVGSFDFDWGYTVEVCDKTGAQIVMFKESGQDVVKEHASDSPRNMITAAYRERLQKLLEHPELRAALAVPGQVAGR
jgi:hypothetical protein